MLGALHVGRRPIQVALHHQAALRRAVAASVARRRPDVAVLMLSRLGDVVPALDGVPLVVDFVDALAANMARRADRQPWLAPLWRWEACRMARWDRQLLARSRAGLVVASRDRIALLGEDEQKRAGVPVHVVPLGMSLPAATRPRPDGPPTVVLTGNLGYFPTVEGAGWFARHVWPRVRQVHRDAIWRLAGARPAAAVRKLHGQDGVEVVANPEDLDAIRRRAHVAIAPLRAGSGTPIKILEAMADGVPVVTTADGQAGLDALPADALAVGTSGEAMAEAVITLLAAPEAAEAQAARARAWLEDRHEAGAVGRRFEALFESIVAGQDGAS